MCASHKLEMRKEAAQEWRVIMRKKLLITAAAIILSADFIAGGTMAIYRAAAHTDKTISTSSIGVSLNVNEDNIDRNSNENAINTEMVQSSTETACYLPCNPFLTLLPLFLLLIWA